MLKGLLTEKSKKSKVNIAIVGYGKVAKDFHIPAIEKSDFFRLVAIVTKNSYYGDLPNFSSLEDLNSSNLEVNAIAICTPPEKRFVIAQNAIENGLHVLLEKPPFSNVEYCRKFAILAKNSKSTVFTAWHSKYANFVSKVRDLAKQNSIKRFEITWCEDVNKWHPGQDWVTKEGGLGVFDAGINALSILGQILGDSWSPSNVVFKKPKNWETPISANFNLVSHNNEIKGKVNLDWNGGDPEIWQIDLYGDNIKLSLIAGGGKLQINDIESEKTPNHMNEYELVYNNFYELIKDEKSDIDISPLQTVEDVFADAKWVEIAAFNIH